MLTITAMPTITALYAGLLGLMSIAIAFAAGKVRGETGISLGDGGNPQMLLAMRRHANFVEFVPLALILIALLEMNRVSGTAIHVFGASLVVARAAHAMGLSTETTGGIGRALGAGGSTIVVVVASVWAIVTFF